MKDTETLSKLISETAKETVIEINNLKKSFGAQQVLTDLSL
jgi:ABC-type transporter Mla maintaining outer membrane lipid asymmetry ATPase subunit MlaF